MMKGNDDWWVANAGCRGIADGEWVMKETVHSIHAVRTDKGICPYSVGKAFL